ncbi:MAG: hypothetical protein M5U22_00785 [Thermoleophilia bacterium]|nr:hypothetical protein [Thermoleophilia bacterium]
MVTSVTAEDAAESITPLERGKIRRDVLATARGGMNAWLDDDLEAMPQYFGAEYLDEFKKQATTYADEGKIRVRSHSEIVSNVTKIASSGKQALVEYNFTDDSYFTDTNGKVLSEPDHQKTVFQLTLELTDSDWRVVRIIGRSDSLK